MRIVTVTVAGALVLGGGAARAEVDPNEALRGELVAAIGRRDTDAISTRAKLPLVVRNLWFDTPACRRFAGPKVEVDKPELPGFVDCLAALGVGAIADGSSRSLTYGPGVVVAIASRPTTKGLELVGLLAASVPGIAGDVAPIDATTFTAHVQGSAREVPPDAKMRQAIDASNDAVAVVELVVCVDATGRVDKVAIASSSPEFPGYGARVEQAVRGWKVKPFEARGKGVRACTKLRVGYPEARIPAAPPPPPGKRGPAAGPKPEVVPPTLLEGYRTGGTRTILPDPVTLEAIATAKAKRLVGSFKLCVDTTGAVSQIQKLKSTGYPAYDDKLVGEMANWTYKPYEVNGKPVPVCTAVTFLYSKKK